MRIKIIFAFALVVSSLVLFGQNNLPRSSDFKIKKIASQKKISLDINVGVLHSIGKDIIKTYNSNTRPLQIQYFSRKKFENPYINLLTSLNYSLNPKITFGIQSGIYAHFNERYFGYTKQITVSVPLMATLTLNVMKIKLNQLGINVSGGKNFFNVNADNTILKNGELLNVSFSLVNNKRIIKLGVDHQFDKEFITAVVGQPGQPYLNETYKFHLNRLSIALSFGFIIKKFKI